MEIRTALRNQLAGWYCPANNMNQEELDTLVQVLKNGLS